MGWQRRNFQVWAEHKAYSGDREDFKRAWKGAFRKVDPHRIGWRSRWGPDAGPK